MSGGEIGAQHEHVLGRGATAQLDGLPTGGRDVTSPYLVRKEHRQVDGIAGSRAEARGVAAHQPFKLVLALQKISLEALILLLFNGVDPERARSRDL